MDFLSEGELKAREKKVSDEIWKMSYEGCGALWLHDGKPARPHALLTSGLHSNGYVNMALFTQRAKSLQSACESILSFHGGFDKCRPRNCWLIGSQFGSITLANELARLIDCNVGFTEKDGDDMVLSRFSFESGTEVWLAEDIVSTGGTLKKVMAAVRKAGAVIKGIFALGNRSGETQIDGIPIFAASTFSFDVWKPEECPLCRKGSQPLRPKANDNWRLLTSAY